MLSSGTPTSHSLSLPITSLASSQPLQLTTSQALQLATSQPLQLTTSQALQLASSQPLQLTSSQALQLTSNAVQALRDSRPNSRDEIQQINANDKVSNLHLLHFNLISLVLNNKINIFILLGHKSWQIIHSRSQRFAGQRFRYFYTQRWRAVNATFTIFYAVSPFIPGYADTTRRLVYFFKKNNYFSHHIINSFLRI